MEKVTLGKSDLKVTPIAFGAWAIGGWMWGGTDKKDALDALEFSIDNGITTIDTAPIYGFGHSEEIVGEVINKRRDKVELLTKYGMKWDSNKGDYYFDTYDNNGKPLKVYKYAAAESVIKECEVSLKRLKTDYIDLYQIHWPDVTTPVEETMEAVEKLIQQGKVRAAGVSNYDLSLTMKASENLNIVSNQVPYSMLRRDIEKDLLPWCSKHDISILAYSPLQRGLLTGKIKPGYKFGEGDSRPNMPHFSHGNIIKVNEFLSSIEPLAKEKNATIAQLVIAWTLAQEGISVALVGARNRKQVAENLKAGFIKLSDKEVDDITLKLNELKLEL